MSIGKTPLNNSNRIGRASLPEPGDLLLPAQKMAQALSLASLQSAALFLAVISVPSSIDFDTLKSAWERLDLGVLEQVKPKSSFLDVAQAFANDAFNKVHQTSFKEDEGITLWQETYHLVVQDIKLELERYLEESKYVIKNGYQYVLKMSSDLIDEISEIKISERERF